MGNQESLGKNMGGGMQQQDRLRAELSASPEMWQFWAFTWTAFIAISFSAADALKCTWAVFLAKLTLWLGSGYLFLFFRPFQEWLGKLLKLVRIVKTVESGDQQVP